MVSACPLLIFDLDGALFGVDATLVRETVWLPELTPIEEVPAYIVGMFSLRNRLIPVTDLNLRFGHPLRTYRLDDQLVVLEQDQWTMGIIVSEVREVIDLPQAAIRPPAQSGTKAPHSSHLVAGEVRRGDDIIMLLDADQLLQLAQDIELAGKEHPAGRFCPEATSEQREVYRARARALQESPSEEEGAQLALAVLELGGEYFGIRLDAVQEFCNVARPSPIPCCPPHVLGAVNLRGNLFTLLDLRAGLNLPDADFGGKAVIARLGDQAVGVAVDEVHDVVYLHQEELQAAPAALHEQHITEIMGAAAYGGKMMMVLDLPALLAREEWVVND